ncbi:helix-turn-helix transcriptional regulator [Actinoplanes sp. TRM 88003]|uniref:Helix-turn-helix transcriptional regulator n=1 Tax=Paractinoplanes aksuensis TaxID=2939490 RepID=A0ABT1DRQ2_9ACTN|nr:helix-turn-helix transcriptional regulator [Actinoplanes aksuensis]MCO8272695.1 helix-turn-helix transcriptional regulator [Actinoplanes aksuensis]
MQREALGYFLRFRREHTDPTELGLPFRHRRTPGVRRSEVAELANISEIHYTQIEQGRGSRPSADVLAAIARVLRLSAGETQHLFDLAEQAPPRPVAPNVQVSGRTLRLVESLPVPVLVCSARLDVIGQNRASIELLENFAAGDPPRRNLARRHFLPEADDDVWGSTGLAALSRFAAARLRSARARYPDDDGTRELVDELRTRSERFEQMWQEEPVGFLRDTALDVTEVQIRQNAVTCEVTDIPERDQHLVFLPSAHPVRGG